MAKSNDSRGRRKLLEGATQKVKTPSASRAGLPGYGGESIALHAKKPQTASKLNTPTKRSAPPSVTPPTSRLGARKDASHVQPSAGKQSSSAGAVADPYEFPVDDAEDAAAQKRFPASSIGAEKHKMRTSGSRLGGLYQGSLGRGDIHASNTSRQLFNGHPNGQSSSGLSARQAAGQVTAAAGFTTAATVPGACAGGSAAGGSSSMLGRAKQTGIRNFTVPQHSLLGSPTTYAGKLPAGMVNHGNTCYLNAVLQALLSLPCLAQDLTSDQLQQLHLPAQCVTYALRECLQQYTTSCTGAGGERSGCAISPAVVSAAMARLSPRWGGCRQEDAHEFLTALLDAMQTEVLALQHRQLKSLKGPPGTSSSTPTSTTAAFAVSDEVMQDAVVPAADALLGQLPGCRSVLDDQQVPAPAAAAGDGTFEGAEGLVVDVEAADGGGTAGATVAAASADMAPATPVLPSLSVSVARCPASRNFSGCLQHTLICSACNHVSTVKEQFNHLSLDLPVPPCSGTACGSSAPGSPAASKQQQGSEVDWMLSGGLNSKAAGAVSGITAAAAGGSSEQYVPDLQSLLANFFAPEMLDKACEACGASSAQHRLEHAVRRLPRVLVVHLKRFQWQVLAGGGAICRKLSTQVRPDQQLQLGPVCCPGRPVPPLLAELMPPGLLQAAHAACTDPDSSKDCGEAAAKQQGLAGSSKAATGPIGSTGLVVGSNGSLAGGKRSRSEADAAVAPLIVDGELGAAAGCNGNKQQQQLPPQKQHRQQDLKAAWGSLGAAAATAGDGPGFGRQPKPVQHGASRLSRMHAMHDQQEQEQQQQPRTKNVLTRPFDGSTFCSVTATGGRHTDFTQMQQVEDACMGDTGPGLQRNNSSTHVVDLAAEEDEDADLQKALALSLQTAAQEQADRDDPAMLIDRHGDDTLALVQVASMPDWMAGGAAAAAATDPGSGSPRTPKAPTLIAGRQPLQPLKVGTTVKADDLFHWAPQDADTAAAAAAAGGLSGGQGSGPVSGDAGLSGGLAFSDGGAASGGPAVQQQGGGTDQFIGATPPNSPPTRAQGTSTRGNSNNSSGLNWADKGSKLLEGIENLSEEEQMRRAVEQSLLDQGGSTAAGGGAGGVGMGVADAAGYDYDAALAKALAESAAEQERVFLAAQQQQQQGETAVDHQQQDRGEAGTAAAAEQQQGTSLGGDGAAAAAAAAAGDDNAVVVVEGACADGSAADRQQQQRPRWPLVRLVEDSDCEEDDSTRHLEQQLQQIAPAPAAAAIPGGAAAPDAMQVDLQDVAPAAAGSLCNGITAAAAVSQQRQQQHAGKENREDQHAAVSSAAASKQKQFKRTRRPLGELLVDREAAKANRHNPPGSAAAAASALDPPVKEPAVSAAVAAAEAAAAAAAGGSSCKGDELAATDAAAAAEVAGTWPQENAALYQLRAVVRHKGPLASSGHFVSDVMSNQQGGQWFHYDDSFVQPTRLETVTRRCETDGYLFFYVNTAISSQQPSCKKQL